jgi:hypothetical protein
MDIKKVFIHKDFDKEIYMEQPHFDETFSHVATITTVLVLITP